MRKKSRSPPPWSELPPEILHHIGEFTEYPFYQIQFRAVCKPWRSAFGIVENRGIKNFPLKIPNHPSLGFGLEHKASLFVVSTRSYVIQPTNGSFKGSSFLVTADEINPGFLSPREPLSESGRRVWGLGNQCRWLDLLENRVKVLDSGFSVRLLHVRGNALVKDGRENELRDEWRAYSSKAVVLSNPSCEDDLLIVVLNYGGTLMALRVKEGEWKAVFGSGVDMCADVVKFKEKIYGIDRLGRAFYIDYDYGSGDTNIVPVAPALEDGVTRARRLVVDSSSNGKRLYMVVQMICSSDFAFSVYGLNEDEGVWEKVSNIGNQMFFVGVNYSFCATSRDFPGLSMSCMRSFPQNCIFFGKGSFTVKPYEVYDGDMLLFGMNRGDWHAHWSVLPGGQMCHWNPRARICYNVFSSNLALFLERSSN